MSATGALRQRLRSRLLDNMIRAVGEAGSWKVLVVDREALRILAAALGGLNDLVDEGVTIIEMLDMRREPLPRIPAIFFCAPSAESIQALIAEAPRQYKEFHLFFTHRVPDFQMDELKGKAGILKRVKTFVELNVELLATESRVFSLDRPGASIPQMFGGTPKDALDEMSVLSERLADACGLVGRELDWTVRADGASSKARTVGSLVKEQLGTIKLEARMARATREAEGKEALPDEKWGEDEGVKPAKATLLVLDRASDLISPLMHEFTYQAMAHDLLPLQYDKPGGVHHDLPQDDDPKEKAKCLLWDDEGTDTTWVATRHMFVEDAKVDAQDRFKTFLETDAAYKIRGKEGVDVNINEMSAAVRSLPASQKRADKHSLHIVALNECLARCTALQLPQLAIAEQDIAIGRHPDTTRVKPDVVIETLTELVHDDRISLQHRIRLLMLAIAVAEGTVALGGESSLLALTSSFKLRLGRSSAADIPDLSPVMASTVKGFQTILTKAIEASTAFAAKHGDGPSRSGQRGRGSQAQQFANDIKSKYDERRDVKMKEKQIERSRRRRAGRAADDELPLDVQRYLPPLTSVALDLVDDKLAEHMFPSIGAVSVDSIISNLGSTSVADSSPSKRRRGYSRGNSGPSFQDMEEEEKYMVADEEHLYVIFFVGGVTFSEIRSVYDVCKRRQANILIGGSQVLTPAAFLDACAAVADPIVRMKVMLPPLPIELAQSRAARERTLKEGAEKRAAAEKKFKADKAAAARPSAAAADSPGEDAADPEGPEVVVGYKKKKLFGRRKK